MNKLQTILQEYGFRDEVSNPKVSIIVPVYNTSEYLEKCMLSLIQQTLKEVEIICVDDGSQDNSYSILSEFTKYDSRIKLIKQEHKLQGAARNNGMLNAKGEYVGFVDSDDWVDLDYFEKLYNAAKKYDSDIALATNIRTGNGKTKKRLNITEEKFVITLQDKIDIGNQAKNPCPTNKIYKRKMLEENNITLSEEIFCEDKLFTIQAIYYANGIVSVPNCYYYYFRNPNSTVKSREKTHKNKAMLDKNLANLSVLNFLKSNNAIVRDKQFWAISKYYPSNTFPLIVKKESLKTANYYLFGVIKLLEKKI